MPPSPENERVRSRRAGFTLIELILVMAVLAITAALVVPRMSSFLHGRELSSEARRLLSLTRYAQSRAVAEGLPVVLWVNPSDGAYGVEIQPGYVDTDEHAISFTVAGGIAIDVQRPTPASSSELGDETLGLPPNLAVVRFLPSGFVDESSVSEITLHEGDQAACTLSVAANRLGYEIRPAKSI